MTSDTLPDHDLALSLGLLSEWRGGDASVWQGALNAERTPRSRPAWQRRGAWALASAACLVLVCGTVLFRGMGVARGPAPASVAARADHVAAGEVMRRELTAGYAVSDAAEPEAFKESLLRVPASSGAAQSAPQRFVVHRCTMELATRDVHAAFAKCTLIPSPAVSEYVEASTISGEGEHARAELTLRVAIDRLSTVLNELRGFAIVTREQAGGQDVTDQVVDLDARLRNEQRIEQELLALLASKKDASLEDILRVQQELSRVREQVERMQAQRDALARLTSLATVLVIIRHEGGPAQPPPNGFAQAMSRAWSRGVADLGNFTGGLVRLTIAGLPIWIMLGVAAVLTHQALKRRRAARAEEPAPAV